MKKYMLLSLFFLGGMLIAPQAKSQDQQPEQQNEEIIIRKKGDFPKKLIIQLNGDKVTINGKKPENIKGNIEVIRKKSSGNGDEMYGFDQSIQPYNGMSHGFNFTPGHSLLPEDHNKALLGVLTLPGDSIAGARVVEVERGTPADSAELHKGDIIVKINNTSIHSAEDLSKAISQYSPDDKVTVTYKRNAKTHRVDVKLGRNDNGGTHYALHAPLDQFHFRGPSGHTNPQNFMKQFRQIHPFLNPEMNHKPHLGMTVENRDDKKGVTVKQVNPGSAAEQSGFKSGDILSVFAGQKITGVDDVLDALHDHQHDQSIQATVIRNGQKKTLTVKIPTVHQQANL